MLKCYFNLLLCGSFIFLGDYYYMTNPITSLALACGCSRRRTSDNASVAAGMASGTAGALSFIAANSCGAPVGLSVLSSGVAGTGAAFLASQVSSKKSESVSENAASAGIVAPVTLVAGVAAGYGSHLAGAGPVVTTVVSTVASAYTAGALSARVRGYFPH
jgi:hypothetical protein